VLVNTLEQLHRRLALLKNCHPDPGIKSLPKILRGVPVDVVFMVRVEMKLPNFFSLAAPNHGTTESHRETGFVINASALSGEVGHHELRVSDFSDDLIRNFVVVLFSIDSDWLEACV